MTDYPSICPVPRTGSLIGINEQGAQSLEEDWHELLPLTEDSLLDGHVVNRPVLVCRFCARQAQAATWAGILAHRVEERAAYLQEKVDAARKRPLTPAPRLLVPRPADGRGGPF